MNYKELKPFRFWCQKVLPLTYDDSLSYYELLCKVVDYLNHTMEDVTVLHDYVQHYFDNLDVQDEINRKLDELAESGGLGKLSEYIDRKDNEVRTELLNQILTRKPNNKNRKIIAIGDSYAEGYTPDGNVRGWSDYLAGFLGCDVTRIHRGGSGFLVGTTFLDLLKGFTGDKKSITDIVVCGGYNDQYLYGEQLRNAIDAFCNYCKANFPNANIYIGCVGWCVTGKTTGTHARASSVHCRATYLDYNLACISNGGYPIVYAPYWALNRFFSSDFVHPNGNGNYQIALIVSCALNGVDNPVVNYLDEDIALVPASGITVTGPFANTKCCGSTFRFDVKPNVALALSTNRNITFNQRVLLGKFEHPFVQGRYHEMRIPVSVVCMYEDGASFYPLHCHLLISEGNVYLDDQIVSGNGYLTLNGVKRFTFNGTTCIIPRIEQ